MANVKNFKRRYLLIKKAEVLPEIVSTIISRQGRIEGTRRWAEEIAENGSEEELTKLEDFFRTIA